MSQKFKIEIISPENTIYSGEKDEVILPCYEGQITVLKEHIPLITFLRPGLIQIDKDEKFYTEDGTVEFADNNLLILSATVISLKKLDANQVNTMLSDAERMLSNEQSSDKQRYILNYKIETLRQINR